MGPDDETARLSALGTRWAQLLRAHGADAGAAEAARRDLLLRYHRAAYRYLRGVLRDPAAAEGLAQEFADRFLRGDFRNADPGRGRFRDFLKAALRHLARDHWRRQGRAPAALDGGPAAGCAGPDAEPDDLDRPFLGHWREELLARAWEALREEEGRTGRPHHRALRCRAEHPEAPVAELARGFAEGGGRPVSDEAFRQLLHRARSRVADLLVAEVAQSVRTGDPKVLAQELIDLDLMGYCRSALKRFC
jgi:RNA polymerase sigma-70 factor (ECF subfamily)